MKLALLDHDPATRVALETIAAAEGFHCTVFSTGRSLMRSLHREAHDLLLLDWDLPDLSGPTLLESIRNQIGAAPPLILLTAPLASADHAHALHAGADCVLAKPCVETVVAAQIKAAARRSAKCDTLSSETYGQHTFQLGSRTLVVNGIAPHLTPKEFSLALMLFRNLNRAISRSHLLETIWGIDPALSTRTLDIHVSKIRSKLGLKPEAGYRLCPVYGFGYRLEEYRG